MTEDRLIFFGTDAFSLPSLIQLLAENWPVVAVVTKPDSHTGRGRKLTYPAVKRVALAKGINVLQPSRVSDISDELGALHPTAGIVVAYGKILPEPIIDLFPKGLINVHASLLPSHRGAAPIEASILDDDDKTGVTLMQIEPGVDTGPTYAAAVIQLVGGETRPQLYEKLAEMGADLLTNKLEAILSGNIVALPQDNALASHMSLIKKSDGTIDWSKPAKVIEREIRAYLGWPGSHTEIAGTQIKVSAAHILSQNGPAGKAFRTAAGELAVHCGHGSLVIDELTPAGKRQMSGAEFLAGHRI